MRRGFLAETRILSLMVTIGSVLILSAQAPTPPNPVGEWNLKTDAQGQIADFYSDDYQGRRSVKGKSGFRAIWSAGADRS